MTVFQEQLLLSSFGWYAWAWEVQGLPAQRRRYFRKHQAAAHQSLPAYQWEQCFDRLFQQAYPRTFPPR